jgi:2-polyprenyl-3-methyl-5-hydroxy-6-metoxy-1,4-benzoquinol methylase
MQTISDQTQSVTQSNVPTADWPLDGIERVKICPICDARSRSMLYTDLIDRVFFCAPGVWTLYRCRRCSAAYLDPRPTQKTIGLAYTRYYTHYVPETVQPAATPQIPLARLRLALRNGYLNRRYGYKLKPAISLGYLFAQLLPASRAREDRWFRHLPYTAPHPRLLDVGCGSGLFLARMRAFGWDVQGVDPDTEAVTAAQQAGLPVEQGTLESIRLLENHFDAVTLSHVIEHVHDPVATLRACYHVLRPGGTIWIGTPNLAAYGHSLFGQHWRGLEPPRHLVLFTPSALRLALQKAGFRIISAPQANWTAEWMFSSSAAIEQGLDPYASAQLLTSQQRWHERLSGLLTYLRPALAEELIMVAQKS